MATLPPPTPRLWKEARSLPWSQLPCPLVSILWKKDQVTGPSQRFAVVERKDSTGHRVCPLPGTRGPATCIPSLCPPSAGPPAEKAGQSCFPPQNTAGMKIPQPHPNHSPTSQSSISLAQCSPQRDVLSSPDRSHGLILCSPSPPQLPPRKTAALQRLRCLFRNLCDQKHSSPIRGLLHFLKNLGDDWV